MDSSIAIRKRAAAPHACLFLQRVRRGLLGSLGGVAACAAWAVQAQAPQEPQGQADAPQGPAAIQAPAPGQLPAQAADLAPLAPFKPVESYFDVYSGIVFTDNATRGFDNPRSDEIVMLGTDLNVHRQGRELQLDAMGDLDYAQFLQHTYGSRFFGNFDGTAQWGRATDWFQYFVRDTFGQLNTDPLAPATAATLENVNYLSTGPTFNIPFSSLMRLSLYGSYSKVTYQQSDNFDSHSVLGGVSLTRRLSNVSTVALVSEYQNTQFADQVDYGHFDLERYFGRYALNALRTDINLEVGYQSLSDLGVSGRGLFLDAEIGRRISPSSSVFIRGDDAYSTAGDLLRGEIGNGAPAVTGSAAGNVAAAPPFHERTYSAGWRFNRPRTSFSIEAFRVRDSYESRANLDNATTSVAGTFLRRISPTVSLTGQARFDAVKFIGLGSYNQLMIQAGITKTFARLSTSFQFERFDQTSGNAGAKYHEDRVEVRLSYGIGSARGGAGAPRVGAGGAMRAGPY
ncbi:MAG TPA: hypothetical protein VHB68_12845 [Steroidobacteraceae bacterium]|nr:hypothetical protein [Steroidobacteraceae bacterium]